MELKNVTVHTRANIRFDGKVIAHTCVHPNGDMSFLGVVMPGTYHGLLLYDESFEVTDGTVELTLDGSMHSTTYTTGDKVFIKGNQGFTVTVTDLPCQFLGTVHPH